MKQFDVHSSSCLNWIDQDGTAIKSIGSNRWCDCCNYLLNAFMSWWSCRVVSIFLLLCVIGGSTTGTAPLCMHAGCTILYYPVLYSFLLF